MALIFARLAQNFIKNGYFPTDNETLERIQEHLIPGKGQTIRVLDPCCGEGAALADLSHWLHERMPDASVVESYGVEFDKERAWHAKNILYRAIHADVHDVVIKARSIGLLFLNPPYGFGVADTANVANVETGKAERLERTFLKKAVPYLAQGGVLVYIIPYYALDEEIRTYLARNFTDLRFFMSPEQRFRQCVIFGKKTRVGHPRKDVLDMLARAQAGELLDQVLPVTCHEKPYVVPPASDGQEFDFHAVRMDREQLAEELCKWHHSLLWEGFETRFNQKMTEHRRPLRDMTSWHLALALAAGQVTGCIHSKNGRIFLIKGDTFKKKERKQTTEVDEDGNVSETIVMLDKFVPIINAIEFTPDHRLGEIVKIS